MKLDNRWHPCKRRPPTPYTRVEIKDSKGKRYIGYYTDHGVYLESVHHNVIEDARLWRSLPTPNATWDDWDLSWMFPALKVKEGYMVDGETS